MNLRLRELRENMDMTQSQVADAIFCSQQAYSNYELGYRNIPAGTLIQLAYLYDTTVDYILGITSFRDIPNEMQRSVPPPPPPPQKSKQIKATNSQ